MCFGGGRFEYCAKHGQPVMQTVIDQSGHLDSFNTMLHAK